MVKRTEKVDPELIEAIIKLLDKGFMQGYNAGIRVGREQGLEEGYETCSEALKRALSEMKDTIGKPEEQQSPSVESPRNEDINIDDLGLSERPYNCLRRVGIDNIADLIARSPKDLLTIYMFGLKGLDEVRTKLAERNLKLKDDN